MLKTAFRFLTYDRSNLLGILAGIIVSVVLVGIELGIFNSMAENAKGLTHNYPHYVWVVNPKTQSALQLQNLDVRVGRELQSLPGVQHVYPLVLTTGSAKSPGGTKLSVQILGIQAPEFRGGALSYTPSTNLLDLINEGAVIFDQTDLPKLDNMRIGEHLTVNDQRVYLSGLSRGMVGFGTSYVTTTLERARQLSGLSPNYVNAYLLAVDTTLVSRAAIIRRINVEIPQARAVGGEQLGTETMRYLLTTSNVVAGFLMMVVFSFMGGFAIVGVTLYSSVNDRIRDYGTIKAIGGSNGLLRRLILLQGVLYAGFGFGGAYAVLLLLQLGSAQTGVGLTFPGWLVGMLVFVTVFISLASSLIAMRKITRLEPVQIFRM